MAKLLIKPMSEADFIQMTLLANGIAVMEMVKEREKPGKRRAAYADIIMRMKRVERSIPGHLEGRSLDASVEFYNGLHEVVGRFIDTFKGD